MANPAPQPNASPRIAIAAAIGIVVFVVGVCVSTAPLRRRYGLTTQSEHMAAQRAARSEIAARSQRLLATTPADDPSHPYVRKTCAQVVDQFGIGGEGSSDVRATRWAERYQGRRVRWAASANRVIPMPGGLVQVQFKCSEHSFLYDGNVLIEDRDGVGALPQDTVFSFEGELLSESSVLGVQVVHAHPLPP